MIIGFCCLIRVFLYDVGLCPSQAERFEWARRASEQFDRDGLFLMALFFERGEDLRLLDVL
jgi:hypothetical protein